MERLCAAGTSHVNRACNCLFSSSVILTVDNLFPGVRKTLGLFWSFNLKFLLVMHAYLDG